MAKNIIKTSLVLLTLLWGTVASAEEEHIQNIASKNGDFRIAITRSNQPPVGQFTTWTLSVTDSQDKPVNQAKIRIGGGMPGHGHGLPTAPQVQSSGQSGQYILNGLKFSMHGQWEIKLFIESEQTQDFAVLELDI